MQTGIKIGNAEKSAFPKPNDYQFDCHLLNNPDFASSFYLHLIVIRGWGKY